MPQPIAAFPSSLVPNMPQSVLGSAVPASGMGAGEMASNGFALVLADSLQTSGSIAAVSGAAAPASAIVPSTQAETGDRPLLFRRPLALAPVDNEAALSAAAHGALDMPLEFAQFPNISLPADEPAPETAPARPDEEGSSTGGEAGPVPIATFLAQAPMAPAAVTVANNAPAVAQNSDRQPAADPVNPIPSQNMSAVPGNMLLRPQPFADSPPPIPTIEATTEADAKSAGAVLAGSQSRPHDESARGSDIPPPPQTFDIESRFRPADSAKVPSLFGIPGTIPENDPEAALPANILAALEGLHAKSQPSAITNHEPASSLVSTPQTSNEYLSNPRSTALSQSSGEAFEDSPSRYAQDTAIAVRPTQTSRAFRQEQPTPVPTGRTEPEIVPGNSVAQPQTVIAPQEILRLSAKSDSAAERPGIEAPSAVLAKGESTLPQPAKEPTKSQSDGPDAHVPASHRADLVAASAGADANSAATKLSGQDVDGPDENLPAPVRSNLPQAAASTLPSSSDAATPFAAGSFLSNEAFALSHNAVLDSAVPQLTGSASAAPSRMADATIFDAAALPKIADPAGLKNLATRIAFASNKGERNFEIRLDPPELGRIEVTLTLNSDGSGEAELRADKPQTLELLQKDAPALERALKEAGLNLSNALAFSLRSDGRSAAWREGQGSARNRSAPIVEIDSVAAKDTPNTPLGLLGYGTADARLDIRI